MKNITVNIQREDRLEAINNLSKAIYEVSKALNVPVEVTVQNCTAIASDTAISIQTADKVMTEAFAIEDSQEEQQKGD
jgi:hypothetical protein